MKNRDHRAALARETLAIVEAGGYTAPSGRAVDIAQAVRACVAGTVLRLPEELQALREGLAQAPRRPGPTSIAVTGEDSLAAARRLASEGFAHVGLLNFASARNPGGGFLGGSRAQEESIARSSALHASQTSPAAAPFYAHHRAERAAQYTDRVIVSPACPIFRDDPGALLETPHAPTLLTCAAPNAGALADQGELDGVDHLGGLFQRRAARLLAAAAAAGCDALVLGAWGCGVFRNDPAMVAGIWHQLLRAPGAEFADRFAHVCFAVFDQDARGVLRSFEEALA